MPDSPPPAPLALVDCATWSVTADAARAALLEARAALFVRVYEKIIAGPREELDTSYAGHMTLPLKTRRRTRGAPCSLRTS